MIEIADMLIDKDKISMVTQPRRFGDPKDLSAANMYVIGMIVDGVNIPVTGPINELNEVYQLVKGLRA